MEIEAASQCACNLRLYIFYFYLLSSCDLSLPFFGMKKTDASPAVNLNVTQIQDQFLDVFRKDVPFPWLFLCVFVWERDRKGRFLHIL